MGGTGKHSLQGLKEHLINLPAFGHPHYQISLFLFVYEKEGNTLGVLAQKKRTAIDPWGLTASN